MASAQEPEAAAAAPAAPAEPLQRAVLVTGGNQGIGLALVMRLLKDTDCRVFMTSRDPDKGRAALLSSGLPPEAASFCTVVQMDVTSDESVQAAAAKVKDEMGTTAALFAIVNNAGTGLAHGVSKEQILNTNFFGPKRVLDAFGPMLIPEGARIVNVGSGAAGRYVKRLGETDEARMLIKGEAGYEELLDYANKKLASVDDFGAYGLSKACLAAWTQVLPKDFPCALSSCCSPGFIDTAIVKGYGAKKTPDEGTVPIRKLLFEPLAGNGWYYSSDGLRGPYHFMRNPGEPEYDGKMPF